MRARARARFVVSWVVSCAHPRNGADVVGKGANAANRPTFQRCASLVRGACVVGACAVPCVPLRVVSARCGVVVVDGAPFRAVRCRCCFVCPQMARHTHATLTARVGMVARALGVPDGDRAGALHLVRQNGGVSLFVRHTAGMNGGELLHHGSPAETVAFLQGLIMADAVRAMVRRAL